MKRIFPIVALAFIVVVLAIAAYRMFASDETKIRWVLADAAESFNATKLSGCLAAFDPEYRDTSGRTVDREVLTQALRFVFLRDVGGKPKTFLMRVRLPDETLGLERLDSGGFTAKFVLHLDRRRGTEWQPAWGLSVTAEMRDSEEGWRIHRSAHETISGKPPR